MATVIILTPKPKPRTAGQQPDTSNSGEWTVPDNLSFADQLRHIANQIDNVNPQG